MKDVIMSIIKDFHKRGLPEFKKRDISVPLGSGKIVSVIGPRRAGKTYLMYQAISGIKDITNVIYINFEDERLDIKAKDLNLIIDAYFELYPDKKESDILFFFDELQEIDGWEKFVRRLYDTISKNIFITGSSSKLLSKEIATSLRGRTIAYEVFPLSFKEYLYFKGIEEDIHSTKGKAKVNSAFNYYLERGGFPETISMNKEMYEKTITTYFEVMLYKDIVERHGITNVVPIKLFLKKLIAGIAREFTIYKIYNEFKSGGLKISKDNLYKFLGYCEEAYALLPISNFSESLSKQTIKKSYSIDIGLSRMVSFALNKETGRLFENVILLELKRRGKDTYFFTENGECDFVTKEKDKIAEAIQVCYELNENNREREIAGLRNAMKRFGLKRGIIITNNQEQDIGSISIVPAYKWLLGKKSRTKK